TTNFFRKTGLLMLAREHDPYCEATLTTLKRLNANHERLGHDELRQRFPQFDSSSIAWGVLEPDAGVLLARRAVQAVVAQAQAEGVDYLEAAVASPSIAEGKLNSVRTISGKDIHADRFVFACGPWLPKLFPELLGELIHVTRQEIVFFGVPPGDESFNQDVLPAWIDFN